MQLVEEPIWIIARKLFGGYVGGSFDRVDAEFFEVEEFLGVD